MLMGAFLIVTLLIAGVQVWMENAEHKEQGRKWKR